MNRRPDDLELWLFRALWLVLPFTAGPLVSDALTDTSRPFEVGSTILLWSLWGVMLVATMVPRTETLTLLRIVPTAGFIAMIWAAFEARTDASAAMVSLALITTGAAALFTLRSAIGDLFVDGSSYGDETRFLLSTPGALVLGPIEIVWSLLVAGATAGPLFLLAQRWIIGVIVLLAGWTLFWFAVPVLHRLSNRWLVFVPAGIVVHDKTALREPQLFRKESIAFFGPAPADTDAEDLTLDGLGLALRAQLKEPSKIIPNGRNVEADLVEISGFLVSPNRPGAVVAEAKRRGYDIG